MFNKRKAPRLSCLVPVEAQAGNFFDLSKTVDFSKGGIGLVSRLDIPLHKQMAIELDLDEQGHSVLVLGEVQWVTPLANGLFRIGLAFKEVMQGSKSRLSGYFKEKV
ncbi:MAG: PilZ domain-containing protein [Candidatus Omnitrophica bacterium]|nr:PilZ domain-containing protein [Candidatus Omnitrophota bacterium]